jgi:hypothetical protein
VKRSADMISPEASSQAQSLNALLIAADMTSGTAAPIPTIATTATTATAAVEAVPELYTQQLQQQHQQLQQQQQQTVAAVIGGASSDSSGSAVTDSAPAQLTWGTVISNNSADSSANGSSNAIDTSAGQATAQGKSMFTCLSMLACLCATMTQRWHFAQNLVNECCIKKYCVHKATTNETCYHSCLLTIHCFV